jgi:hypothetical protein
VSSALVRAAHPFVPGSAATGSGLAVVSGWALRLRAIRRGRYNCVRISDSTVVRARGSGRPHPLAPETEATRAGSPALGGYVRMPIVSAVPE